jgi:hypothetical protein
MDEYINKQQLLEKAKEHQNTPFGIPLIIAEIEKAETVEIKHGEWRLHPDGSGTCSVCGRRQKSVWDMDNWQNYCGHCGANMNGGNAE